MSKAKNDYFNSWRKQNPNLWHLIQARWYHRVKKKFLLGQKKLSPEEAELFAEFEDKKIEREILRQLSIIEKQDKGWKEYGI
jgi:hypothetical protein